MLNLLEELVEEVNSREHLKALLDGVNLKISLETEKEAALLWINNGMLEYRDGLEQYTDVWLRGDAAILEEVLRGKLPLRKAVENTQLSLKASYRTVLFFESVFLLAMTNLIEHEKTTEISK